MRISKIFGLTLALAGSLGGLAVPLAQAIERADGTVSFEKAPRLIEAVTTFNETHVWGATYYFTLELPENIGEPLGQVTIQQRQGVEAIQFKVADSLAFSGTRHHKGERLALAEVTEDETTQTISVRFDQPVPPGQTVTIGLYPVHNPQIGGVYLFGVTAFPAAQKPYGLYLGVGRLQFYDGQDF
ncbi:MAG TPA: hypothetical protein DDZ80_02785 [Cyanobacteria bacterium UBA8803]|nr:hypothetical protein [Cyanobacteria bacterium UBA9273]HBL57504.1 hypothetical protein [Cyanobacteria bacterium UBA8803]